MSIIKIVKHKPSGAVLHNGRWTELSEDLDPTLFGSFADIQQGGQYSEGIIDTAYYEPSLFDKEEWDEEDDIIDDYEQIDYNIKDYVVKYHNFRPDYSVPNNHGGYTHHFESFETLEEAEEFLENLDEKYRGEIL